MKCNNILKNNNTSWPNGVYPRTQDCFNIQKSITVTCYISVKKTKKERKYDYLTR